MINELTFKKTAAGIVLTIGFLMTGNVLLSLKGIENDYAKLFSIVGNVGSLLIGAGMFYLGWQQHQLRKLSEEEKKIIRENHNKFRDGINKLYNSYEDSSGTNEAKEILREAANQANLELPVDLKSHVQGAYDLSQKLSLEIKKPKPNDYDKFYNEISERFLSHEPYKKHSKYLTIHR
jgi:hypothetical protein